jgi:diguanylate cyclase (GGDEF)-like protein
MRTRLNEILASDDLPSLPEVAIRVIEIAKQDEPDFAELASVIRLDPAICARLLKTANSALFGLRTQVSSVEAAIPSLGVTLVRTLVLGFTLGDRILFSSSRMKGCARRIWRSSIVQATTAETLAQRIEGADPPTWFLTGMLQNIGKLAMLSGLKNQYTDVVSSADSFESEQAREKRAFGCTHVEVGAELCRRWNMDDQIISTFESRLEHTESVDPSPHEAGRDSLLLPAVSIGRMTADYFAEVVRDLERNRSCIDDALIRSMAIPPDELVSFYSDIDRRTDEVAAFMRIDIGQEPVLEQVLADAHATLARIAIQNQVDSLIAYRQTAKSGFFKKPAPSTETLREVAERDENTRVHKQAILNDSIEMHLKESREKQQSLGFLLLDVDRLGSFAENNGQEAADDLICETASVLVTSLRTNDFVVRSGDDEFIAILPGADSTMIKNISERIRFRFAAMKPAPSGSRPAVSCSIGAVRCDPGGRKHPQVKQILRELDSAVFQSKKRGGNHVSVINLTGTKSKPDHSPQVLVAHC